MPWHTAESSQSRLLGARYTFHGSCDISLQREVTRLHMRWFRAAHHHLIGPNAAGSHAVADLTLLSVLLGRYTLAGLEALHTVAAAASLLLPAFSCAGLLALATVAVPSLPPLLKPPLLPPPPTEGINSALPLLHLADLRQPPLFWLHQMLRPEEVLG